MILYKVFQRTPEGFLTSVAAPVSHRIHYAKKKEAVALDGGFFCFSWKAAARSFKKDFENGSEAEYELWEVEAQGVQLPPRTIPDPWGPISYEDVVQFWRGELRKYVRMIDVPEGTVLAHKVTPMRRLA